ncbi:hypothetical protein VHEMI04595 [[Torrubiella] hemipterigena]|uniref:NAD-dependent epimerase/dehydratase domain-containing protein n=1 Tax=[Torrubiella] hemipterigena TaxID=1531966 RepID=A0A0A1TEV8_9HYPO|nr:hypothetical protein VHEMI04595 [[Torrubiella] hemipterigena]
MPKILVIGATGYLGSRLCGFLVQTGLHRVYGIARAPEKAKGLALSEVTPILCPDPVNEPSPYLTAIQEHNIDIVVDVAGADAQSAKFLADVADIGRQRLERFAAAGIPNGPKLGFIYCSGSWVHGSSNKLVNDLDIVGAEGSLAPPPLIAWRVAFEKTVHAASSTLAVAVVRPALIYGRENTIWTSYLLPLLQASRENTAPRVEIPLDPRSRAGLIHVDDAATGIQAVIEQLDQIAATTYPVFDLVTSQESMRDVFEAAAAAWGYTGAVELVGHGGDAFHEAMSTTFNGSSARARQLLGWQPRRVNGMVADMEVYAAAFASQH